MHADVRVPLARNRQNLWHPFEQVPRRPLFTLTRQPLHSTACISGRSATLITFEAPRAPFMSGCERGTVRARAQRTSRLWSAATLRFSCSSYEASEALVLCCVL